MEVKELKKGDENGVGDVFRSRWRSALPYTLEFDSEVVRVEPMSLIEARAFGELEGRGIWRFATVVSATNAGGRTFTQVTYDWRVKTTKAWMNWLAPIAKPFFHWNHDTIMRWGAEGLAKRLNANLIKS